MDATYEYMDKAFIDPELNCSICQSLLIDPRCISCTDIFCRECITNWIQKGNDSCPVCQKAISINDLTEVPHSLQTRLDRLRVKCIVCGQDEMQRVNFDEHIQKVCPKTVISCSSADIKCPWTGQRDQLNQHLIDCRFESMRPLITPLINENQQLKNLVNQQTIQITRQQNEIQQLIEQVNQQSAEIDAYQNENQQINKRQKQKDSKIGSMRSPLGGAGGENKVVVEPHRHRGVFIGRSKDSDMLLTKNMVVGESVYGENRISVDGANQEKIEYRVWNPFQSKLGAAVIGGIENIHISPGKKVLYLGAATGITVSHVSDIVGSNGVVYAVESSQESAGDLLSLAKKRTNIIPIIEDARYPNRYQMHIGTVDTIFADVVQPDQTRILALNANQFLKNGGHYVISIAASCIDSTSAADVVFSDEVKKLRSEKLKPHEQVTLEPYERDHAVVVGVYQPNENDKK